MNKLQNHIYDVWINILNRIDKKTLDDIYAFSFFVYDENDDPRLPTLTIGFNTNTNLNESIKDASDSSEAKWNYAFWIQNQLAVIGDYKDKDGKVLISNWIDELGLNFTDKDVEQDLDNCMKKSEKITSEFIKILINVVKKTHESNVTETPIIIHELEYYDAIKDQNILANGEQRIEEFTDWINEWYM